MKETFMIEQDDREPELQLMADEREYKMVEVNKVVLCDKCRRIVANKKCPLCKADICEECSNEVGVGTIVLNLCSELKRIRYKSRSFWKDFNENEKMEEKIIEYLNKNLILERFDNGEEDYEDEEDEELTPLKNDLKRGMMEMRNLK